MAASGPDAFEKVAGAVAKLNITTGAAGGPLQALSRQVLDASRLLGEDATKNAEAFGRALTQWQRPAKEGGQLLDFLFAKSQQYGIGLGVLIGQLTEFGSVLRNAGFSLEETADLQGRLAAAGSSSRRWPRASRGRSPSGRARARISDRA